jgi:plasmid stabilization system protein ParE
VTAPYRVLTEAEADLLQLFDHLLTVWDDGEAARRRIRRILDALDRLAVNPGLGHRRPDLTDRPVLFWSVLGEYAVIYRPSDPVEIVRVLAWKRDLARLLAVGQGEA